VGVPEITPEVLIDILLGREPEVTAKDKVSSESALVAAVVNVLVPLSISWIIPNEPAALVKAGVGAKSKACDKSADTSPEAVVTLILYLSFAPALATNALDGTNVKDVALTKVVVHGNKAPLVPTQVTDTPAEKLVPVTVIVSLMASKLVGAAALTVGGVSTTFQADPV
tara:strand:- start:153 stop:659 length:507 start_codon:yes stop_codon:yes gene_type:complete